MSNKYRDNAIDPTHLRIILDVASAGLSELLFLIATNTESLTRGEYQAWVADWKKNYNALSVDINAAKKAGQLSAASHMKILANTLLNARRYARDRRRSIVTAALEEEDPTKKNNG